MQTLLIIGNGFDIAHDLDTKYPSFYNNLSIDLKNEWQELTKKYVPEETVKNWTKFEELINYLTDDWFQNELESYQKERTDANVIQLMNEIERINIIFKKLELELFDFLQEIELNDLQKFDFFKKILTNSDFVINFNYTKTTEKYGVKSYHIHGSLEESFIVFGHPMRPEFNGISEKAVENCKVRKRNYLSFYRFLKNKNLTDDSIKQEMDLFKNYHLSFYNGKGPNYLDYYSLKDRQRIISPFELREEDWENFKLKFIEDYSELIFQYAIMKDFQVNQLSKEYNFENVGTVAVLGHSVKADFEVYEEILINAPFIHNVVYYCNPSKQSEKDINEAYEKLCEVYGDRVSVEHYNL